MDFILTARVDKQIFKGEFGLLYIVKEPRTTKDGEAYEKNWKVSSKTELQEGETYDFSGFITETVDKAVKDSNGKDVYRTNYKVTNATPKRF